jgi:hypothetical protein
VNNVLFGGRGFDVQYLLKWLFDLAHCIPLYQYMEAPLKLECKKRI